MWFIKKRSNSEDESRKALDEANQSLKKAKSRDAEVTRIVGSLRAIRDKNHFAEQLTVIMTTHHGRRI